MSMANDPTPTSRTSLVSPKERRAVLAERERLRVENERLQRMRFDIARLKAENASLRAEREPSKSARALHSVYAPAEAADDDQRRLKRAEQRRVDAELRAIRRLQRPARGGLPGLGKNKG
jgi:hypothetical protein